MIEKPFFFSSGNSDLFGILHTPEKNNLNSGFVFCHPLAEEKLWAHRVLLKFARLLTLQGYTVLRFDFMGEGDSDGKFSESTITTRIADILTAIDILKTTIPNCNQLGVLGLRFGATLASLACDQSDDISKLILWEPVLSGPRYIKELLRINITTQTAVYKEVRFNSEALINQMKNGGFVNVDGYELSWPMYIEMSNLDLIEKHNFTGETLIVQINRREGAGIIRMQPLAQLYPNSIALEAVEAPFWKEIRQYYANANNLFDITYNWLFNNDK